MRSEMTTERRDDANSVIVEAEHRPGAIDNEYLRLPGFTWKRFPVLASLFVYRFTDP